MKLKNDPWLSTRWANYTVEILPRYAVAWIILVEGDEQQDQLSR